MKKIISVLLIIATIFCIASCAKEYRSDISTAELSEAVAKKLSNPDILVSTDEYFIEYFNEEYASLAKEFSAKQSNSGTSFDEYGIFKVNDQADTAKIKTMIEEYIQFRIDADMGYVPEELPKIKNAEIKIIGNYVAYAFLSDSDKTAAFAEIENKLTK